MADFLINVALELEKSFEELCLDTEIDLLCYLPLDVIITIEVDDSS